MKSQWNACVRQIARTIILCFGAFAVTIAPTFIHAQSSPVPIPPEAVFRAEDWNPNTAKSAPAYQWDRSSDIPAVAPALGGATWIEQGPGPILFEANTVTPPDSPASGAINAIAPSPTNADLLYIGTVNGGIWRTSNLTAANPTWTPLTDQQLPALSINSLALSPLNANVLFAGTGSTSSLNFEGSPGFGVARSIDGGNTWMVLAVSTFAGRPINSIVPTTLDNGNVVLAATLRGGPGGGVFRSSNLGTSFTRLSGDGTSGLPDQGVSSLVADPGNPARFYAAVPAFSGTTGNEGVYRSDNGGLTWTSISTGLTGLNTSLRILLSVHNNSALGTNAIYAAIISSGHLQGVFRSADDGGSWTALGVPAPEIFPGGQGSIHGAIVAHPTDANVVFIAGDRQDLPFPNPNGCNTFNANIFRGNAAQLPANPWQSVVCNGANGTAPHADSRVMVFDANRDLLHGDDGGINRLLNPDGQVGVRQWVAVNRGIRAVELHSVAYDPLSKIVFGGTQDNGTPIQSGPGEFTWVQLRGGDGGNVAVDNDQTAHPGTTIRYTSSQFFGFFNRTTWNAANTRGGGFTQVQLRIISGAGNGSTLFQVDPNIQFYQPYVLNAIDPSRMLIGTANIYESLDRGDSLANLLFTGFFIGDTLGSSPLAYGGRLNGQANPDVFYVGAGANIFHRVNIGDPITTLGAYPGGRVRTLVIDPLNYRTIYVVDFLNRVWASLNEGASWINLTANLLSLSSDIRAIDVVSREATPNALLVVGGLGGVFQMANPGSPGGSWSVLSSELPHGFVRDLHYNATDDVLVAAILGRGAWLLPNVSQESPLQVVNDSVTFEPITSTFNTTSDSSGCPSGFVGKFGFDAKVTNISGSSLSSLVTQVAALTGNNLLENADGGPGGVGARLTVPTKDDFSDGVLSPRQFVDVPIVICLKQIQRFNFFVDVLGIVDSGSVASVK